MTYRFLYKRDQELSKETNPDHRKERRENNPIGDDQ